MYKYKIVLNGQGGYFFCALLNVSIIEFWIKNKSIELLQEYILAHYLNDENIWILDGRRSSVPPTSQKAYEIFKKKFKAYIDRDTNLIVVSFEHISPSFAKNLINTSVNYLMK